MKLSEALDETVAKGHRRLHLPAHRGGPGNAELEAWLGKRALERDLTEVDGLDDLYAPQGVLSDLCGRIASHYGGDAGFVLTQGSTQGVIALIMAACPPGSRLLLSPAAHRSVAAALILQDVEPVFLPPPAMAPQGAVLPHAPEQVAAAVAAAPDVRACLLTSPTYEGLFTDIAAAARHLRAKGVPLLVDAAHGAHAGYGGLPDPPTRLGADGAVYGLHKSGGSLTQTACVAASGLLAEKVAGALRLLGTASPSYLLMASVEKALDNLEEHGEMLVRSAIHAGKAFSGPAVLSPGGFLRDGGRVFVRSQGAGVLPGTFDACPEYALEDAFLLYLGLGQARDETLVALSQAVRALEGPTGPPSPMAFSPPVMPPRRAYFAPREKVGLRLAVGRIATEAVALSPPSVPAVWPGGRFTEASIEALLQSASGRPVGVDPEGNVFVVVEG